jgi:2-oxoglutarate ferredoxin oxidoreductase subunit alpha
MQGDEACAEGAIAAGCDLFAGYPISPATEISERMAKRLPKVGGIFVQGVDELDSLAIVIGAVWGGYKAMTATSGNGICLMQENIGYAVMTETPCVIVDVQRAGPGTGIATKAAQGDFYQIRYGSNSDYAIIALAPSSPQEMFDLTIEAFNLSEIYRVPTFILADEIVGLMREKVVIPDESKMKRVSRKKPKVKPEEFVPYRVKSDIDVPAMACFGDGYGMPVIGITYTDTGSPTTSMEIHHKLVRRLYNKIEKNVKNIAKIETKFLDDADIVILSWGSPSRSAYKAMLDARKEGLKVGYVRLITLWPFPDFKIKEVAEIAHTIVVPEMNMGMVAREVERASNGRAEVVLISKPGVEAHTPDEILRVVRGVSK